MDGGTLLSTVDASHRHGETKSSIQFNYLIRERLWCVSVAVDCGYLFGFLAVCYVFRPPPPSPPPVPPFRPSPFDCMQNSNSATKQIIHFGHPFGEESMLILLLISSMRSGRIQEKNLNKPWNRLPPTHKSLRCCAIFHAPCFFRWTQFIYFVSNSRWYCISCNCCCYLAYTTIDCAINRKSPWLLHTEHMWRYSEFPCWGNPNLAG